VTEKSEIFRIASSVRRMFENTFADPNVTAEMKEVELVVVTSLDVVVVVGIPSENDHVVTQDFCRMICALRRDVRTCDVRTRPFRQIQFGPTEAFEAEDKHLIA